MKRINKTIVLSLFLNYEPVTQKVNFPGFDLRGCSVHIRHDNNFHPYISGNKYFKLKYNVAYALKEGYTSLLTFGGAYSNHILATAVAASVVDL